MKILTFEPIKNWLLTQVFTIWRRPWLNYHSIQRHKSYLHKPSYTSYWFYALCEYLISTIFLDPYYKVIAGTCDDTSLGSGFAELGFDVLRHEYPIAHQSEHVKGRTERVEHENTIFQQPLYCLFEVWKTMIVKLKLTKNYFSVCTYPLTLKIWYNVVFWPENVLSTFLASTIEFCLRIASLGRVLGKNAIAIAIINSIMPNGTQPVKIVPMSKISVIVVKNLDQIAKKSTSPLCQDPIHLESFVPKSGTTSGLMYCFKVKDAST